MQKNVSGIPLVALTIAGFDPSGGAGVIADLKTFTAFGCWATAAVTALTFQNTQGVFGAQHASAATVRRQILPLLADYKIAGVKTGMLPTRAVIREVTRLFREENLPAPVVDPVVRSTSGYDLIDAAALSALIEKLLPLARVVTPNIPEAERITGVKITDDETMLRAAEKLRALGARAVLLKGGHGKAIRNYEGGRRKSGGKWKTDLLLDKNKLVEARDLLAVDLLMDENGAVYWLRGAWIESENTHGTGCTLAAALAACLTHGLELERSARIAKQFVADAIRAASTLGHGHGGVNHNVAPDWNVMSEPPA